MSDISPFDIPGDDVFEYGVETSLTPSRGRRNARTSYAHHASQRGGFGMLFMMVAIAVFCMSGFAVGTLAQAAVGLGSGQNEAPPPPYLVNRTVVY